MKACSKQSFGKQTPMQIEALNYMNHNLIRFDDNKTCQCTLAYFLFSQKVFAFEATSFLK